MAVTLRIRHGFENGKQLKSWALVSMQSKEDAQVIIDTYALDDAVKSSKLETIQKQFFEDKALHKPGLVQSLDALTVRPVDENQAALSTGSLGRILRLHMEARAAKSWDHLSSAAEHKAEHTVTGEIAIALVLPLCDLLCKDVQDVDADEWQRAAQVLAAISGVAPHRVSDECVVRGQRNFLSVWNTPRNALGVAIAKSSDSFTSEDALTIACALSPRAVQWFARPIRPHELARGKVINPRFIHAGKYGPMSSVSTNLVLCQMIRLWNRIDELPDFVLRKLLAYCCRIASGTNPSIHLTDVNNVRTLQPESLQLLSMAVLVR
eukprot:SAG31_NODE_4346_length_3329_cov_1.499690_4_plen_322_part_00